MSDNDQDKNLEQLRKKADEADQLRAELAARDRRDAFAAAGIDTSQGVGKAVAELFKPEGEYTADDVKEFARQYGWTEPTPDPPAAEQTPVEPQAQETVTEAERAHFAQQNAAMNSDSVGEMAQGTAGDQMFRAFEAETRNGAPREDAQKAGLAKIFQAAAAGDKSALYNGDEYRSRAQ